MLEKYQRRKPLALQVDTKLDILRSQGQILDTGKTKTRDLYEGALSADDVPDDVPAPVLNDPELDKIFSQPIHSNRGKYLIEIRFGSHRSRDYAVARIDLFENSTLSIEQRVADPESVESFTVGTVRLFMCGYPDCGHPIPESHVGSHISRDSISKIPREMWEQKMRKHWAICPTCQDKKRNNMGRQVSSAEFAGYKMRVKRGDKESKAAEETRLRAASNNPYIVDPMTKARYAVLRDCIMIAAPMRYVAELTAKLWDMFEGSADVYMKYNPRGLREQIASGYYNEQQAVYDEKDELAIYPMGNIIRDTANGSTLVSRFEAFFLS